MQIKSMNMHEKLRVLNCMFFLVHAEAWVDGLVTLTVRAPLCLQSKLG
jgi:hypothetical protein